MPPLNVCGVLGLPGDPGDPGHPCLILKEGDDCRG
jgi:hypothetical protein